MGDFQKLKKILGAKLSLWTFAIPVTLCTVACAFEAVGMALFIPLIKGVLEQNFDFISETKGLGSIIKILYGEAMPSQTVIFFTLLGFIYVVITARTTLRYISSLMVIRKVRGFCHDLRVALFDKIVHMPQKFFDARSPAQLQNVIVSSTQSIGTESERINDFFTDLLTCIVYAALLLVISWQLTLIVLTIPLVLYFFLRGRYYKIRALVLQNSRLLNSMTIKLKGSTDCIPLIRSLNAEDMEVEAFRRRSYLLERNERKTDMLFYSLKPLQEHFEVLAFLLIVTAAYFIFPELRQGRFASQAVYLIALRRCLHCMVFSGILKQILMRLAGHISQVHEIFEEAEKVESEALEGKEPFKNLKSCISIRDVEFAYPERKPLLKGVNLDIHRGRVMAIIGSTGSGKTTLLNLLTRTFEPTAGQILIDGKDLLDYSVPTIRDRFAFVTQNIFLFDGTMRENLCFGIKNPPSDERLFEALDLASIGDFVRFLPQGLETELGDRGLLLSGGERQRLSLARAFLRQPEIILLDEPSASLDPVTEGVVWENVTRVWKDKTILLVTHRLSMLTEVNDIVELRDGQIVNVPHAKTPAKNLTPSLTITPVATLTL